MTTPPDEAAEDVVEDVLEETVALPESALIAGLVTDNPGVTWHLSRGQDVLRVPAELLGDVAAGAKAAGFELAVDLTVVDRLGIREPRFEVSVVLRSIAHATVVRLLVEVPSEEDPEVVSLTPIWPGLSFFEREAYDMFGVRFVGHPDLTRILMPDDWEGHPLRRDYGVGDVPVQFKAAPRST